MTTHPIIDRLSTLSSEELTVSDVVFVLGLLDRKPVDGLIKSGALEAQKGGSHARGTDPMGRDIRHRYTIAAAAVLTYLVRITGGDRAVLLDAIAKRFPQHLALCKSLAGTGQAHPLPGNVIPMHKGPTRRSHKTDPFAGQPDLFGGMTA